MKLMKIYYKFNIYLTKTFYLIIIYNNIIIILIITKKKKIKYKLNI